MSTRGERRIWAVVSVHALVLAVVVLALWVQDQPLRHTPGVLSLPLVVAAFVLAQSRPVYIPTAAGLHTVSFSEVPLVLGFLFVDPLSLVLGTMIGVGLVGAYFRHPLLKQSVNILNAGAWTGLGSVVFALLIDDATTLGPPVWLAAILCAAIVWVAQAAVIEVVICHATGRPVGLVTDGRELVASGLVSLAAVSVTLIGVVVTTVDWRNFLLWSGPAMLALLAAQQRICEAERTAAAKFVVRATTSLRHVRDVEQMVLDSVHHLQVVFDCEAVHLFLETPAGTRRATTGDQDAGSLHLPGETTVRHLLQDPSRSVRLLGGRRADTAALAAELHASTGLLVPLRDGNDLLGAIWLVERRLRPFTDDHVELGRELAATVSTSLRRSWFERSLALAQDETRAAEHRARHDPLTGLPNRLELEHRFGRGIVAGGSTLFFLDLDGFKTVNDELGHEAGDAVLRTVAARLRATLRPGDLAVRHGGDEFLVVSHGLGGDEAEHVADRLDNALSRPVQHGHDVIEVGVSVGYAVAEDGEVLHSVLSRADERMYATKRSRSTRTARA